MKKVYVLFLFIISLIIPQHLFANDAKSVMQRVVDETFSNIVNKGLNEASAKTAFKSLIKNEVDLDKVTKLLMGKQTTVEKLQQEGVLDSFKDFIAGHLASIYASQIRSGTDAKVVLQDGVASENDPLIGDVSIVKMTIETSQYGKVKIEWYICGGKIVDAKVESKFRMSLTLRDQYRQVWKQSGGSAQSFMAKLKETLPY